MAWITVKPAESGLLVRNHQDRYRPLPDEGKMVEDDFTWQKRLRDGDVVMVEEKPAPTVAPVAAPKEPVESDYSKSFKADPETRRERQKKSD